MVQIFSDSGITESMRKAPTRDRAMEGRNGQPATTNAVTQTGHCRARAIVFNVESRRERVKNAISYELSSYTSIRA